jgi:hypothetical protein
MSLLSSVITDIRVEINDTGSTRFTDDTTVILPLVKQAIRRANRICQRAGLHFAKKSAALNTVANQAYVPMPDDLDIPIGLWRDDTHNKIIQRTESEWEQIISATGLANWFLDVVNSKILFNGTPSDVTALTMWYFPTVDPSAYTVASTMPWSGKLDDIIARYVALRIQNLDEMNVTMDEKILQDMEVSIVSTYQSQAPIMVAREGWM